MKRVLPVIALLATLALSLFGCSAPEEDEPTPAETYRVVGYDFYVTEYGADTALNSEEAGGYSYSYTECELEVGKEYLIHFLLDYSLAEDTAVASDMVCDLLYDTDAIELTYVAGEGYKLRVLKPVKNSAVIIEYRTPADKYETSPALIITAE